jgi:thioredoxin reductase (NADPH)
MAERAISHKKIEMVWNTVIEEITPDEAGLVNAIKVRSRENGELKTIDCKGVFVAIGHVPNTAPFKGKLAMDEEGYLVPEGTSNVRTSAERVYVAGDCADHVYRQAITAAGMGCQAAIEAERALGVI